MVAGSAKVFRSPVSGRGKALSVFFTLIEHPLFLQYHSALVACCESPFLVQQVIGDDYLVKHIPVSLVVVRSLTLDVMQIIKEIVVVTHLDIPTLVKGLKAICKASVSGLIVKVAHNNHLKVRFSGK